MPQAERRRRKERRTDKWLPFWLLAPTIIVLLIVQVYPALCTVWLSVHEREPQGWVPVGLDNFRRILSTSLFQEAVGHTVVFLVGYVALTLILGFFIAEILNRLAATWRGLPFITLLLLASLQTIPSLAANPWTTPFNE